MDKYNEYIKIKGILVIWVLVIIHINLIFNLCTMVSGITNKEFKVSNLEQVLDEKLDEVNQFEKINTIYSNCSHSWEKLGESDTNGCMAFSCSKCGTIQVINMAKEALYINVGK